MTPAEVAALRHMMGLTLDAFAAMLGVHPRTVRSWESGRDELSPSSAAAVRALARRHSDLVRQYLDAGVPIGIVRDVGDAIPPRGWYLAAAGQALAVEPNLSVEWLPAGGPTPESPPPPRG